MFCRFHTIVIHAVCNGDFINCINIPLGLLYNFPSENSGMVSSLPSVIENST